MKKKAVHSHQILWIHNNGSKLADYSPWGRKELDLTQRLTLSLSGSPDSLDSKESACNVWDPGSIPGSGRFPGGGNGYPLQYSCLDDSMDEPGGLQSAGLQRVEYDWATNNKMLEYMC